MTHEDQSTRFEELLQLLSEHGFDGMAEAIEILMNEAMKLERAETLGAMPYQRTEARRGYANGFKPKTVNSRLGRLRLKVPQTRDIEFYPSALERGERSERALKLAVAEMYVQGVSTRKVAEITQELCGLEISSTQVSRAAELLDEELEAWRQRPLSTVPYVILDARYEKVRHGGSVRDCAVLIAIGILENGQRSVLGVSVSLSEAEVHWRTFLKSLIDRGLHGVQMIVSDDHTGLKQARKACFPGVVWQRCQFHLMQNALHYVPKISMRTEVIVDLRNVFNAPDRAEADRLLGQLVKKYRSSAPDLSSWLETDVPEGLAVFELPATHRRRLRTTNMLERTNQEIKRRTRVATLFPNEASLLRLVSAILSEISDDWETGKTYLTTSGPSKSLCTNTWGTPLSSSAIGMV
jgi:transposase-like protein